MTLPEVSIILPCRNAAPWLGDSLGSALAQEGVKPEVILIDDGSTDGSAEHARRLGGARIRIERTPGCGAAAARNRGLALARGRWIQFLDADDALAPDKLRTQLRLLADAPAGTVASARWGRFPARGRPADAIFADAAVERDYAPATDFLLQQAETGCMMHPAAWLCPRELLNEAGGWDERLSLNDDGEYFARVLARARAIRFVSAARSWYRSAIPGSLSRQRTPAALASLHASVLTLERVLLAAPSERTRPALAELWERTRFELYPEAVALSAEAGRRARSFGRPRTTLPCGPRLRWLVALGAWRLARRLQLRARPDLVR
jgi:hypothetical protein